MTYVYYQTLKEKVLYIDDVSEGHLYDCIILFDKIKNSFMTLLNFLSILTRGFYQNSFKFLFFFANIIFIKKKIHKFDMKNETIIKEESTK